METNTNHQITEQDLAKELLDGTAIDFRWPLVRLAYILQHAATLHPMAGDLQAAFNSETAGISNIES